MPSSRDEAAQQYSHKTHVFLATTAAAIDNRKSSAGYNLILLHLLRRHNHLYSPQHIFRITYISSDKHKIAKSMDMFMRK